MGASVEEVRVAVLRTTAEGDEVVLVGSGANGGERTVQVMEGSKRIVSAEQVGEADEEGRYEAGFVLETATGELLEGMSVSFFPRPTRVDTSRVWQSQLRLNAATSPFLHPPYPLSPSSAPKSSTSSSPLLSLPPLHLSRA